MQTALDALAMLTVFAALGCWLAVLACLLASIRPAITAVWTAQDAEGGTPMSTFTHLEIESGARKRVRITGLDRRRNAVALEALLLTSTNTAALDVAPDPDEAGAFIVTARELGTGELLLECDARPGDGFKTLRDVRAFTVHAPDAIATKWNEEDLPELDPVDGEGEEQGAEGIGEEPGAGEQGGEQQPGGEGTEGGEQTQGDSGVDQGESSTQGAGSSTSEAGSSTEGGETAEQQATAEAGTTGEPQGTGGGEQQADTAEHAGAGETAERPQQ